jgi:PHP family Zn ribbon phosphoesterase
MNEPKTVNLCVPMQINLDQKQINELVEKVFRENNFVPVDECEMLHEFDDYYILTCCECRSYFKQELFTDAPKFCPYCGRKIKK